MAQMRKSRLLGWCPNCNEYSCYVYTEGSRRAEVCSNSGCCFSQRLPDLKGGSIDEDAVCNDSSVQPGSPG